MIVVLLGPPGSGKGTQAKKLVAERQWPQLSTGDMLRTAIAAGSRMGAQAKSFMDQGALVPDSVVVGLILERTEEADCKDGFILDGFPRNISQAEALDTMLKVQGRMVEKVVFFKIPDEDLVRRLSGRRTCIDCGAMYHVESAPTLAPNVCDQCGKDVTQRPDDQPEVIKKRLAVYHLQTEPLVGFYRGQNKLLSLDARQPASEVFQALIKVLE
jgi:adenylate kinase